MPKFLSSLNFGKRARRRSRRSPASLVPGLIAQADSEVLEKRTLLAAQLVASDATEMTVSAGQSISIPVTYQTLDDAGSPAALRATLISANLHFDSSALTYVDSTGFFAEDIVVIPNATQLETDPAITGDDNDAATDTVITAAYSDTPTPLNPENTGWPNAPATAPLTLFVANFTVNAGFTGSTSVNFSANATGNVVGQAASFEFQSASVALNAANTSTAPVFDAIDYFPTTNQPTLSWGAVDGTTEYEVWIGRISPNQTRILAAESTTAGTSFTPSTEYTPGFYRAWVRADSGEWSAEVAFEIKPTLVHPVSATFEARPTFEWDAIPEAPGYELFVRTTDNTVGTDGDIIVSDIPAGTTTWTPDVDLTGPIRWWVRPSDAIGNRGWSDVGLTRMDGRADVLSVTASTITWTPVTGSSRYVLMVQDTATNEIVLRVDNHGLQGTSYDLDTALASGTYRTWVKAIDASTNLFADSLWSRGFDATI